MIIAELCSCRQSGQLKPDKHASDLETMDSIKNDERQKALINNLERYIDTEYKYIDSTGKVITIQNSFPKGGGDIDGIRGYTDANGIQYGHGIFWTRVINETAIPLELKINFPADSMAITSCPDAYYKLFLPPDTITISKLSQYNYGITGLRNFLDTNFNKSTRLQRIINPDEEYIFCIVLLVHLPDNGPIRTGFIAEGHDLFYNVSIEPFGSTLIPCGQLFLKTENK